MRAYRDRDLYSQRRNYNFRIRIARERERERERERYLLCTSPNRRVRNKGFLRWIWAQGRTPDTADFPKNASGPVGIPLKRRNLRRQAINLAPTRRVRVRGDGPLKLEEEVLGA